MIINVNLQLKSYMCIHIYNLLFNILILYGDFVFTLFTQ